MRREVPTVELALFAPQLNLFSPRFPDALPPPRPVRCCLACPSCAQRSVLSPPSCPMSFPFVCCSAPLLRHHALSPSALIHSLSTVLPLCRFLVPSSHLSGSAVSSICLCLLLAVASLFVATSWRSLVAGFHALLLFACVCIPSYSAGLLLLLTDRLHNRLLLVKASYVRSLFNIGTV